MATTTSLSVFGSIANWFLPNTKQSVETKRSKGEQDDSMEMNKKEKESERKCEMLYCTLCLDERCRFAYMNVKTCSPTLMAGLEWNRNLCPFECQMDCMIGNYHNLTTEGKYLYQGAK